MNATISTAILRPVRTLLVVSLLAGASVACTSAGATSGVGASATPAPTPPLPSPSPSAAPASQAPGPTASLLPASPASFHVALIDELNSGATVDIVDASGTLVGAHAAGLDEQPPNPGAPTSGDVTVTNLDPTTLWVSWTAGNCPDAHVLTIDASGRSMTISQPPFCGGDTIGVGRNLVLSFSHPIAAADVTATLVAVGASPSP